MSRTAKVYGYSDDLTIVNVGKGGLEANTDNHEAHVVFSDGTVIFVGEDATSESGWFITVQKCVSLAVSVEYEIMHNDGIPRPVATVTGEFDWVCVGEYKAL